MHQLRHEGKIILFYSDGTLKEVVDTRPILHGPVWRETTPEEVKMYESLLKKELEK